MQLNIKKKRNMEEKYELAIEEAAMKLGYSFERKPKKEKNSCIVFLGRK